MSVGVDCQDGYSVVEMVEPATMTRVSITQFPSHEDIKIECVPRSVPSLATITPRGIL